MKIEQRQYISEKWSSEEINTSAQLVLVFVSSDLLQDLTIHTSLQNFYPHSNIVYTSAYGEIMGNNVFDKSVSVSAITFEKTPIKILSKEVKAREKSKDIAKDLAKNLLTDNLRHILVFLDGLGVNGAELIKGMKEVLPKNIGVTGGLAGDNPSIIKNTYTGINSFSIENNIVMIGFYGDSIKIGSCSISGWTKFGIKRTITKSKGNIVYEFDGKPALDLYKDYLGNKSGVFFPIPISIFDKNEDEAVVRTLLTINENDKSIAFSADVPEGSYAYFMKANYDDLVIGAGDSAKEAYKLNPQAEFALLVSCVSRKLVLRQRIEEEIEAISSIVGKDCKIAGFYSYGEIGNNIYTGADYFLHNQTMTSTLISED